MLGDPPIKSLDFIVFGDDGARLLVDVKGRRFPMGPPERPRRVWECWSTREDVDGLERWAGLSGRGYRGLLVFAYHVLPSVELPDDVEDLWTWRGRRYLMRAVPSADYRRHMRRAQPQVGHRDAAARRFPLAGPALAPLHPASSRPRRRMSGGVMNRLKIGVRLESLGLPLRRALFEASRLGVAGVQRGRGRRPVAEPPVGDRPARVPPPSALPQPRIDRPRLSPAARPRRRGGPAAAHRARPQSDDAQLRPRPARGDRGGRRRSRRGRGGARPAADRVADGAGRPRRPRRRRPGAWRRAWSPARR